MFEVTVGREGHLSRDKCATVVADSKDNGVSFTFFVFGGRFYCCFAFGLLPVDAFVAFAIARDTLPPACGVCCPKGLWPWVHR